MANYGDYPKSNLYPIGSMGPVYLSICLVDFYAMYLNPNIQYMDPLGVAFAWVHFVGDQDADGCWG